MVIETGNWQEINCLHIPDKFSFEININNVGFWRKKNRMKICTQ